MGGRGTVSRVWVPTTCQCVMVTRGLHGGQSTVWGVWGVGAHL